MTEEERSEAEQNKRDEDLNSFHHQHVLVITCLSTKPRIKPERPLLLLGLFLCVI